MTEFLYSALEGGFSINSFCFLSLIPFTRVWGYDVSSCEHTILWTIDFEQNEDLIYHTLSATKPFRPSFYRLCLSKEDNTSRFIYINQDLFIYIKIYLYKSRFIYIHQDLFVYIKFHISVLRLIYVKIHIHRDCDKLTSSIKSNWFAWLILSSLRCRSTRSLSTVYCGRPS